MNRRPDRSPRKAVNQTQPKGTPTPSRPSSRRSANKSGRTWMVVSIAVLIIVVVVVAATRAGGGGTGTTSATAFDLPRLGAEGRVTLAASAGKPTVVNMFASWCDQCDAELPEFHRAAEALRGQVEFVFVNSNETGNWRSMADRHKLLDFTVAKDVGGTQGNGLYRSLGGTGGMPMTAFYGVDGRLLNTVPGALVGNSLRQALKSAYGITY